MSLVFSGILFRRLEPARVGNNSIKNSISNGAILEEFKPMLFEKMSRVIRQNNFHTGKDPVRHGRFTAGDMWIPWPKKLTKYAFPVGIHM